MTEPAEQTAATAQVNATTTTNKNKKTRKANQSVLETSKQITETETGTDGDEANKSATKKRVRKRKSLNNTSVAATDVATPAAPTTPNPTPKLFFHSKGGTGSKTPTFGKDNVAVPASPLKHSPLSLNKSKNSSPQSLKQTPNKKFKLHKAKSSSSENLNEISSASGEDDDAQSAADPVGDNKKRKLPQPAVSDPFAFTKNKLNYTSPSWKNAIKCPDTP